jgi:hypothetical protein
LIIDGSATIVAVGKMLRQNNFVTSGAAGARDSGRGRGNARPDLPSTSCCPAGSQRLAATAPQPATKAVRSS